MKRILGSRNVLYPLPTVLVGANVDGKPNYTAIAHLGVLDFSTVAVSMGRIHHTNLGIKQNKTFSINIPSVRHVRETDYCGLVSGRDADKGALF
jgi:flavin reductase (DIM6/NTAB) family NADH-FMN oxidoreductase RutF